MPIGCHIDMLSNIWVPYKIAYDKTPFYKADPRTKIHILPQLLVVPYYKLIKPILHPALNKIWKNYDFTFDNNAWLKYSKNKYVYRINFFTKIPFLIFDILSLFFFIKLFKTKKQKKIAFYLWWFNPLSFYIVYLFGRFETYASLFMILSFLFAQKKQFGKSCIFVGIAAAFRYYPIILFPIYVIMFSKTLKDYIKYSFLCIIPVFISNLIWIIPALNEPSKTFSFKNTGIGQVTSDEHGDFVFSLKISGYYIFIFSYCILLLKTFFEKEKTFDNFWKYLFILHLIFYSFVKVEPQYFFWITYFIIYILIIDLKKNLTIGIVSGFVYLSYLLVWGKNALTLLFLPILPNFFYGLPGTRKIIKFFFNFVMFRDSIRTIITGICIFYVFYLLSIKKKYILEKNEN